MDILHNPGFWIGLVAGASLMLVLGLSLIALLGFIDTRTGDIEAHQHDLEAIRYGAAPTVAHPAANDGAIDLSDAFRRPRSARAELRSRPR